MSVSALVPAATPSAGVAAGLPVGPVVSGPHALALTGVVRSAMVTSAAPGQSSLLVVHSDGCPVGGHRGWGPPPAPSQLPPPPPLLPPPPLPLLSPTGPPRALPGRGAGSGWSMCSANSSPSMLRSWSSSGGLGLASSRYGFSLSMLSWTTKWGGDLMRYIVLLTGAMMVYGLVQKEESFLATPALTAGVKSQTFMHTLKVFLSW